MKLDILITKYLDGELSPSEDKELREILAKSPEAKAAFDTDVAVHLTLKQEAATIVPPAELVRDTEDLVLMRILNQTFQKEDSRKKVGWFSHTVVMGLLAVGLAPFVLTMVGDQYGESNRLFSEISTPSLQTIAEHDVQPSGAVDGSPAEIAEGALLAGIAAIGNVPQYEETNSPSFVQPNDIVVSDALSVAENEYSQVVSGAVFDSFTDENEDFLALNAHGDVLEAFDEASVFHGAPGNTASAMITQGAFRQPFNALHGLEQSSAALMNPEPVVNIGPQVALSNIIVPSLNKKVLITTTFGVDLISDANLGKNSPGISFVSQSLGFRLDESSNVGLEIGTLSFTHLSRTMVPAEVDETPSTGGIDVVYGNDRPATKLQQELFITGIARGPYGGGRANNRSEGLSNGGDQNNDRNEDLHGDGGRNDNRNEQEGGSNNGNHVVEEEPSSATPTIENENFIPAFSFQPAEKSTMWGAIFYERQMYSFEKISVLARIGVGGSNDGPMGYIRGVGSYKVTDNIAATVGVNLRAMKFRGADFTAPNDHSLKLGVSFLYGLQIAL